MGKTVEGRDVAFYKTGLYAGYGNYRYGRPGTLPKTSALSPDKRDYLVSKFIIILSNWLSNAYEHEASSRAALRSALCLAGFGWAQADYEAASVLATAFDVMGLERPTESECRPVDHEPTESCVHCGRPLDPYQIGKRYRYCSVLCAKIVLQKRDREGRVVQTAVRRSALLMVLNSKSPPRPCACCGREFSPAYNKPHQKFCSIPCRSKGRVGIRLSRNFERACECCGARFAAGAPHARFCSNRCAKAFDRFTRVAIPSRMSTSAFDYLFTAPVNARPPWLTPSTFDRVFALAA